MSISQIQKLQDCEFEYLLDGHHNNETLLFVHGLGGNISQFVAQYKYFCKKYKVLSVNLRGHGNTKLSHAISVTDVELGKLVKDIIELLDIIGISKVHYIGNSMGGNVGYEFLKTNPDRLKSFTTFGTTAELKTSKFAQKIILFIHKIITPNIRGNIAKIVGQTKSSKHKIKEMMLQAEKSTFMSFLPILSNFNYLDVIKTSSIPTLIIQGEKDNGINKIITSTIDAFEQRGNFTLCKLKTAGHCANLDVPEIFNQKLESFIIKHI